MKKYFILFLFVVVGLSTEVYGQSVRNNQSPSKPFGFVWHNPFLPNRDTVIMRGEEIEVGGYLSEKAIKEFEIIGYGKSNKSDLKKGFYVIKLKPKRTTTYEFKAVNPQLGSTPRLFGRIVYVAKTAEEKKELISTILKDSPLEEKKELEEKLKATLRGPYAKTTYIGGLAENKGSVKITNVSSGRK